MSIDREVCLCFHVTKRKLQNFVRIQKPKHVSQMSECFGAGTGCGWCRPFLKKLFEQSTPHMDSVLSQESPESPAIDANSNAVSGSLLSVNRPDTLANRSIDRTRNEEMGQPGFEELSAEEYARRRAEYKRQRDSRDASETP